MSTDSIFSLRKCSINHGLYDTSSRSPQTWQDFDSTEILLPHVCRYDEYVRRSDKQYQSKFSISIPNEVLEKIVRYCDGRTILKFKMLSKRCSGIVYNAINTNKILWKNICFNEIPEKDLTVMHKNNYTTPIDIGLLSECHYEKLYRQWIHWQANHFNIKFMCQKNFISSTDISKIICHKSKIVVVYSQYTCILSVLMTDMIKEYYRENDIESMITGNEYVTYPKSIVISNRRKNYVHMNIDEDIPNERTCPGFNDCPFIRINKGCNGINCRLPIPHELNTITPDYTIDICCWIKENCIPPNEVHFCNMDVSDLFEYTMFSSLPDGIVIDKMFDNCVQIHKVSQKKCYTIGPWLEDKYIEATAAFIYFNILFVGTKNGYLLAYRLKSWDDVFTIKKKNLLLKSQLNIGKIISIAIMNTDYIKAIAVASTSNIVWVKIN